MYPKAARCIRVHPDASSELRGANKAMEMRHEGTQARRHEVGTREEEQSELTYAFRPLRHFVPACLRAYVPSFAFSRSICFATFFISFVKLSRAARRASSSGILSSADG